METDEQVLQWLNERIGDFITRLQTAHPQNPQTRILMSKLTNVILLPAEESVPRNGAWTNGKFKHSTGELFIAPRDPQGEVRTQSSLLKTVVHELAHATRIKLPGEESHSTQWKNIWRFYLQVGTEELGWDVDIKCAECTFYGLCEQSECPKCRWLQATCGPYTGPP